jgi:predicted O-methyltransferase YrrM
MFLTSGLPARTTLFILPLLAAALFAEDASASAGLRRIFDDVAAEALGLVQARKTRGKIWSLVGRQQGLDEESPHETPLCQSLSKLFPLDPVGESQLKAILARRPPHAGPYQPDETDLMNTLFFGSDPYVDRVVKDMSEVQKAYRSTAVQNSARLQEQIVKALGHAPKLMLEVGSFVGNSVTNTWGPLMKKNGGHVICVDTWEGDINMRLGNQFQNFMKMENGFPHLYDTFQDNVVAAGLTSTVFPLALPSLVGARTMAALKWEFDVAYVDSAHEAGETLVEIHLYYGLLNPGGVLLGDDWDFFPAVRNDVKRFAGCQGLEIQFPASNTWMLQKPK